MSSLEEDSCSDCKLEIIEKKWTQLLLNWVRRESQIHDSALDLPVAGINKCVSPKVQATQLSARGLVDIIYRYKNDICADDVDRAILCSEDIEPFIKYKYPILRLRYFYEEKDLPKKLYIMTSILLFHCCCNSQTGVVDTDICNNLEKEEQEVILKFCEILSDMEATINNVETAVKDAFEAVLESKYITLTTSLNDKKRSPKVTSIEPLVSESITEPSLPVEFDSYSETDTASSKKMTSLTFKSSITVLPSAITDTSTFSNTSSDFKYATNTDRNIEDKDANDSRDVKLFRIENHDNLQMDSRNRCQPDCACTRCSSSGPCCGDPGSSMDNCDQPDQAQRKQEQFQFNWKIYAILVSAVMFTVLIVVLSILPFLKTDHELKRNGNLHRFTEEVRIFRPNTWQCINNLCQKVYQPINTRIFTSHSRCSLLCMGPQLWPYPIGYTYFSKKLVALATNKLEYKFQSVPSETVHQYLAEAFKLFIGDLARLERIGAETKNVTKDLTVKKMNIQIDVESDPDPRLRLDTEEAYNLKVETVVDQVIIKIASSSFCGVRHGLETLSQLILLDQSTGYLITLSNMVVKDAPSYKYRGLMIDTGRNYIPVPDLMRTIDAMATCKLNTFHWRISDVTSFPLYLPNLPQLFEYGGYDRSLIYTKEDVKGLVKRASVRGIRILIEVAAPGPVGRAFSWSSDATCPTKSDNYTCDNVLCLRLNMKDSILDMLQSIYSEIIEMTNVDDVFHMSDSVFSLSNCYYLIEDREGFLDKALERLKLANKGLLPKLPIIWYTTHLMRDFEAKTWERLGVQLNECQPHPSDQFLSKFRVIHSSKWDLSCEMKKQRCKKYRTWQEMYSWKSWRNIEVFTIEGGEATLWTDLVDSGNLDDHLWPRVAAVAERLWSDIIVNTTASGRLYVRLDHHRWRMLLRAVKVQPVWPVWCSFNPGPCLHKLR